LKLPCKRLRTSTQREGGPDRRCRLTCRGGVVGIALALAFVAGSDRVFPQSNPSSEYQVKAAFLFHFAQFVESPAEAFKNGASPLTFCTVGEDPFRGQLEGSLGGKTVNGRPIRVLHFKQAQGIQGCQVLFLRSPEKKFISARLANLKASPILTVGESDKFAEQGGMIGFFLEQDKVRFQINLAAAEKANLKISAKLLALARTVFGKPS
jgi:YfiR/HmsC-like